MERVESKITPEGQVSIPAPIRQKLGLAPGSKVEWCVEGDDVIVRRAARYSSRDIHDALFDAASEPRTVEEMKQGLRRHCTAQACAALAPRSTTSGVNLQSD